MKTLITTMRSLFLGLALAVVSHAASATTTDIYYHNDLAGTPLAATDAGGNPLWRQGYKPYGERLDPKAPAEQQPWFTGKAHVEAAGLSYYGARWYDPQLGRFMGVDPKGFGEENVHSFNRYAYANNNPYRFVDPDGRSPMSVFVGAIARWTGAGFAAGVLADVIGQYAAYGSADLSVAATSSSAKAGAAVGAFTGLGFGAERAAASVAEASSSSRGGTEIVQRWMSNAELQATKETGLLRGGREGTHYVTDAANADPLRARQRLALERTPEVRATLEVQRGLLSGPSKVEPKFSMPGGGAERTATGSVPVRVVGVD